MIPKGARFRWRFYDDGLGYTQSKWHVNSPACEACCCGMSGRVNEHHELTSIEGQYGWETSHVRFDTEDCTIW